MPTWLISIEPELASNTNESYPARMTPDDLVISRNALRKAIGDFQSTRSEAEMYPIANGALTALIIRTLPNDESKLRRQYLDKVPPYPTTEAMNLLVDCGFRHLLVDLPSVDRLFDDGLLSNHRLFWGIEPNSFEVGEFSAPESTITELIYVPDEVEDGVYLLNLQIAPFASDAAPSRPLLFAVSEN